MTRPGPGSVSDAVLRSGPMTSFLNPYLVFSGRAREAMEHYREVLGGELVTTTYGELGDTAHPSDQLLHARLDTDLGFVLMASDSGTGSGSGTDSGTGSGTGSGAERSMRGMVVSLTGDDAEQLHGYWERLCEGGRVTTPMERHPWGDEFGQCVDRFGVPWMVNVSPLPEAPT